MTTLQNSLLLALATRSFGTPTGDPLIDAMHQAILGSTPAIAEMKETGFDTNGLFSLAHLLSSLDRPSVFTLISLATNTEYAVSVQGYMIDGSFKVLVQIYNEGRPGKAWYKMTLVRASNGSIRANHGW
jgi:hypothetical protein